MLRRTNTTSGAYLNYEAMHANDDSDYFLESTFFKRNLISIGHTDPRLQQWQQVRGGVFLQGYWTGKGSVKLPPAGTPRDQLPLPIEVTRFFVYGTDTRINFDGPVILHYINPSLPALRLKYGHIDPANGGGVHRVRGLGRATHTYSSLTTLVQQQTDPGAQLPAGRGRPGGGGGCRAV